MTPAERRDWTRVVLGHADLTAAQKICVIALSTYADFATGRRAFPGEERLAADTGLSVRAVRYALAQAVDLGLIKRTALPNRRGRRATVYALTLPSIAGAAPVDNTITGMGVPVIDAFTGTAVHLCRHRGATFTGTAVPPTIHRPPHERGGPVESSTGGKQGPEASPAPEESPTTELPVFPLHCPDHRHTEHPPKCGGCQRVRETEEGRAAAEQVAETARRAAVSDCPDCQGTHWLTDSDSTPTAKCPHPNLQASA